MKINLIPSFFQYDLEFVTFLRGMLSIGGGEEQLSWHRWTFTSMVGLYRENYETFWKILKKNVMDFWRWKNHEGLWKIMRDGALTGATLGPPMHSADPCVIICLTGNYSLFVPSFNLEDFIQTWRNVSMQSFFTERGHLLRFQGFPNCDHQHCKAELGPLSIF